MAQIGPMVGSRAEDKFGMMELSLTCEWQYTEALTENLDCFLQDPAWQSVLTSVLDENPVTESPFSDRGTAVVLLWSDVAYLPSLWKDVQAVVCSGGFISISTLQNLQFRVTSLDKRLSQWRSTYEPYVRILVRRCSCDSRGGSLLPQCRPRRSGVCHRWWMRALVRIG